MSKREAAEHLLKADQFLAAAELSLAERLSDAATSLAVTAGIHASDAICSARLGEYSRARSHAEALALARQAGPEGRTAATHLSRLLAIKNKAQYDTTAVTADAAARAVAGARKLVALAKRVQAG